MQEIALVVLKSGHKIEVPVNNVASFINSIAASVNPHAVNNYYVEVPIVMNLSEVAAIHPKEWTAKESRCGE